MLSSSEEFLKSSHFLKPSHSRRKRRVTIRPRHSLGIKSRPPDTRSAMRHIEKKEGCFFQKEKILKPSHSANMPEFRPIPTTSRAMRNFENNEDRVIEQRRGSQTLSLWPIAERACPVLDTGGDYLPLSAPARKSQDRVMTTRKVCNTLIL